jgi:hypothetical protein
VGATLKIVEERVKRGASRFDRPGIPMAGTSTVSNDDDAVVAAAIVAAIVREAEAALARKLVV